MRLIHNFGDADGRVEYAQLSNIPSLWPLLAVATARAAALFGLSITDEIREYWQRAYVYTYLLDDLIDERPRAGKDRLAAHELYLRLVGGHTPMLVKFPAWLKLGRAGELDAAQRLMNAAVGRQEQLRTDLIQVGEVMLAQAVLKADARRRVWSYLLGLAREGRYSARVVSDYLRYDANKRSARAFSRWWGAVLTAATLCDSARDLQDDYMAGRTLVRPNFFNRAVLWTVAAMAIMALLYRPIIVAQMLRYGWRELPTTTRVVRK